MFTFQLLFDYTGDDSLINLSKDGTYFFKKQNPSLTELRTEFTRQICLKTQKQSTEYPVK